jgi:hypothetical protein
MALENAMRIHAWWADGTAASPADMGDVHVELNDQFVVTRMAAQDVVALTSAAEMGAMTDEDLFWNLKRGEVLDPGTTYEDWERDRLGAEAPPTDRGPQDEDAEG